MRLRHRVKTPFGAPGPAPGVGDRDRTTCDESVRYQDVINEPLSDR